MGLCVCMGVCECVCVRVCEGLCVSGGREGGMTYRQAGQWVHRARGMQ